MVQNMRVRATLVRVAAFALAAIAAGCAQFGTIQPGEPVTITYAVSANPCLAPGLEISNLALLEDGYSPPITRTATVSVENVLPSMPAAPQPVDGAVEQALDAQLAWEASSDLNCELGQPLEAAGRGLRGFQAGDGGAAARVAHVGHVLDLERGRRQRVEVAVQGQDGGGLEAAGQGRRVHLGDRHPREGLRDGLHSLGPGRGREPDGSRAKAAQKALRLPPVPRPERASQWHWSRVPACSSVQSSWRLVRMMRQSMPADTAEPD